MKTLLAATVALATCSLVSCDLSRGSPDPAPMPSSARPSASPKVPSPSRSPSASATGAAGPSLVLGPRGVGPLRLGMTYEQVAEIGAAQALPGSRHDGWPRGCRVLSYRPERLGRTPGDTLNGTLSARQGLEQLDATRRMVTPAGIRIGSTIREVRVAYNRPGVRDWDEVVVRASRRAVYRIQLSDVVTWIALELRRLDCTR